MRTVALSLLLVATSTAQQPIPMPQPKEDPPRYVIPKLDDKPPAPGSLEEAIASALRLHPDVKLAEAKIQVAEAELEQAKLLAAQRVATAMSKLEHAKATITLAEETVAIVRKRHEQGVVSMADVQAAQVSALKAKADLAAVELELKAAKGGAPRNLGTQVDPHQEAARRSMLRWLITNQGSTTTKSIPAGTVADELKLMIERRVTLDLKEVALDRAMEVLKGVSGPTMTIKLPSIGKQHLKSPPTVTAKVDKLPFIAAVELILDEINNPLQMDNVPDYLRGKYDVYVREYGLLVAREQDAPKDAPTLAEFARQVRAEKGERK